MREVAKSGAAMNGCSALHLTVFGLQPVVKYGNDRLRDTFLPRAAAGESDRGAEEARADDLDRAGQLTGHRGRRASW